MLASVTAPGWAARVGRPDLADTIEDAAIRQLPPAGPRPPARRYLCRQPGCYNTGAMSTRIFSTDKTSFCEGCLTSRPIDEFRRIWKGRPERHSQCNTCHRSEQRERARRRRAKLNRAEVRKGMAALVHAKSLEEVRFVLGLMFTACGGVEGFIKRWIEALAAAPSGATLNFYTAMFNAVQLAQPAEVDPDLLSDEELDAAIAKNTLEFFDANHELVASLLRDCGWTVEAPTAA